MEKPQKTTRKARRQGEGGINKETTFREEPTGTGKARAKGTKILEGRSSTLHSRGAL